MIWYTVVIIISWQITWILHAISGEYMCMYDKYPGKNVKNVYAKHEDFFKLYMPTCISRSTCRHAGLMIHDGIGKYVLPSNHSVLVLSDRCQFGCHGEACERMGRTWLQQTSRVPVGPSDWSPKCGACEDAPDEIATCLSRALGWDMLARTDVF